MDKRRLALTLSLIAAALVGLCGIGFTGLVFAARSFSAEPDWEQSTTPPSGVGALYAVKLPSDARNFFTRESGFQDPRDELIFELNPEDVASFLELNHLTRGEAVTAEAADILKLGGPPRATALEGLENEASEDAGILQLYRHAQLWQWPGRAFIYCEAWGT
jgi:hypothetical protein